MSTTHTVELPGGGSVEISVGEDGAVYVKGDCKEVTLEQKVHFRHVMNQKTVHDTEAAGITLKRLRGGHMTVEPWRERIPALHGPAAVMEVLFDARGSTPGGPGYKIFARGPVPGKPGIRPQLLYRAPLAGYPEKEAS